jgi:hypothetical protein
MHRHADFQPALPLLVVVGNYGSGKTEVSVNLALDLASRGLAVSIADLDVVNPYFRCREATEEMESRGIRVIVPRGELHAAELPVLLPEVRGSIVAAKGVTILDVGGDDVGARILGSLASVVRELPHALYQVVNERRPFTDSVPGCLDIMRRIEAAAKLRVTGLISNTHLMDETDVATVIGGYDLARAVAAEVGIAVELVTADAEVLADIDPERIGHCPVLRINRRMLPPWYLRSQRTDRAARVLMRSHAAPFPGQRPPERA